jgi:hypothetical protein
MTVCPICEHRQISVRHHKAPKGRERRHDRDPDREGNTIDVCGGPGSCHEYFHSIMSQQPYSGPCDQKRLVVARTAFRRLPVGMWVMLPEDVLAEVKRLVRASEDGGRLTQGLGAGRHKIARPRASRPEPDSAEPGPSPDPEDRIVYR